MTDIEMQI